jgi:hypothetical protein
MGRPIRNIHHKEESVCTYLKLVLVVLTVRRLLLRSEDEGDGNRRKEGGKLGRIEPEGGSLWDTGAQE